jgi:biopolymer transport protein ExbD
MKNIARLAVILVASTAVSLGQEGAASRPEGVKLPVTGFVQPFENQDAIVVTISRAQMHEGVEGASRPASSLQAWRIGIGGKTFSLDKEGMDLLREKLRALAGPGKTASTPSERTLLIKADAQAPYGLTQKVLETAAAAMIYKVSIAATDAAGGKTGAFDSWLPRDAASASRPAKPVVEEGEDKGGAPLVPMDEIRVIMSWNTQQNRLERLFGQRLISPTAEGSEELEKLITASREGFAKRGNPDVPLIIDAGPRVPWQNVVEVMDMAKRAGVKKIQFGMGTALEK